MDLKDSREKNSYPTSGSTKRTLSGTLFIFAREAIGSLRHILLIPLFLRAWGTEVYGEWLTIYAMIAYLPLVDIGMQNYVINTMTQCHSKADSLTYMKILHSALRLYLVITFSFVLILGAFVLLAPFTDWLNISITAVSEVKLAAFILGTYILLTLLSGLVSGIYQSLGEFPRKVLLMNIEELLLISFLAFVLFLKCNFVIASLVHVVPLLSILAFIVFDITRRYPEVKLGLSSADWKLSLSFIGPGSFFLLIILSNALRIQGNVLVISAILGASAVSVFSVHRILANLILKVVYPINCALWPELTVAEVRNDYEKMQFVFSLLIKSCLLVSFSFAVFLFFTGEKIIRIWTNNKIEFQPLLWLLFIIYLPINAFWETSAIFQLSTNKHKKYAVVKFISAVIGIVLATIFVKSGLGLVGAMLGFLITETIICAGIIPTETLSIIKADKRKFWLDTAGKGFTGGAIALSAAWLLSKYTCGTVFGVIVSFSAVFFTGILLAYLFWLTKEDKRKLKSALRVVLKRT